MVPAYAVITFFLTLNFFVMAKFTLGAIVTRISGSIGGTTFRRVGSLNVVSNKSFGGSRSKLLNNPSLLRLRNVTQGWFQLSETVRGQYVAFAAATLVSDGLGGTKYLTGRQMYVRLNATKQLTNSPTIDSSDLRAFNDSITNIDAYIDLDADTAFLEVDGITQNQYFFIGLQLVPSVDASPQFTRREKIYIGVTATSFAFDIYAAIMNRYPFLNSSQSVLVYITTCNESGFAPPQYVVPLRFV